LLSRQQELRAMTQATPVLQIRHTDAGDNLTVAAAWPDGRIEEFGSFKNETEANEWIAHKFNDWIREIETARKGG